MNQQTSTGASDKGVNSSNAPALSTSSLLSTNATVQTANPLPRSHPPKDYSAALSILQSRYGASGHALPTPKDKPSQKLQNTTPTAAAIATTPAGDSQVTLVSIPSSNATTASAGTSTQPGKKGGALLSLFKGKGKEKGNN